MKKQKKVKTVVAFILDKSGSMQSCERSTRNGFNEYIQTLKKDNKRGMCSFNLTMFDTEVFQKYVNTDLHDVKELTTKTYTPNGGTALYDAAVETIEAIYKSIQEQDEKPVVLVAIMTDGEENSSKKHDEKCLKNLIHKLQHEGNWTFVFMGANQDAYHNAAKIGISRGNAMQWASDEEGARDAIGLYAMSSSNYLRNASDGRVKGISNFFDVTGGVDTNASQS